MPSNKHTFRGIFDWIPGPEKGETRPDDVPQSAAPKPRQPRSLRDHLRPSLPTYSGPYNVAMMEMELPVSEPQVFSRIKRNGDYALKLETVLFAIYYPAALGTGEGVDPSGRQTWSRPTWLSRPRRSVSHGYSAYADWPKWATTSFLLTTAALTKLPAFRNAALASHFPDVSDDSEIKPDEGQSEEGTPVFPLMMFSHGLGGTRTAYSSICGEFASYGFIVCAVEHRDGSAPRSFINHSLEASPADSNVEVDRTEGVIAEDEVQPHDKIDYIWPKYPRDDTKPGEKVDAVLRTAQIEMRMTEILEVYRIMEELTRGDGEEVARRNLRKMGSKGASSRGLDGVDWESWKGKVQLDSVTMTGHSFGAATTIEVLRHQSKRFSFIGQGIIYDPWGAAIQAPNTELKIHTPLLCINTESFMQWETNYDAIVKVFEEAIEGNEWCWLITIRGSIHINQSDFTLLFPRLSKYALKMTVDPKRALDININASLEFLARVTDKEMIKRNWRNFEGFLDIKPEECFVNWRGEQGDGAGAGNETEADTGTAEKKRRMLNTNIFKFRGENHRKNEVWMHVSPGSKGRVRDDAMETRDAAMREGNTKLGIA